MNTIAGWQALYMSFYSGDLYREVAKNWRGVGYLYLSCVIAGTCLAMSIAVQIFLNNALNKYFEPVIVKCPTITIKDGKLSIDKPTPYIIDIPSSENACIDFDTKDDAKLPEGKTMGILVSPDSVQCYLGDSNDPRPLGSFAQVQGPAVTVDSNTLRGIVDMIKTWTGVALFATWTPVLIIFCMIQTLIYALIGLIVSNIMNVGLSFSQLVRIASVALTPGLLLETLVRCTGHQIQLWGLIAVAIAIGYVIFGVRANVGAASANSVTTSV